MNKDTKTSGVPSLRQQYQSVPVHSWPVRIVLRAVAVWCALMHGQLLAVVVAYTAIIAAISAYLLHTIGVPLWAGWLATFLILITPVYYRD